MGENESPSEKGDALSRAVVTRLQQALVAQLKQPGRFSDELRDALHAAARDARTKHIPPERLLTTLKAIWSALPPPPRAIDSTAHEQLRQELVTTAIRAYYER